jgi:hypothetical protein
MPPRLLLIAAALAILLAPASAQATGCREWNRMSDAQKWERIDRMIQDAITSNRGRSYRVDHARIGRCLEAQSQNMFWDFDGLCSEGRTASMKAIRTRFKQYLWTCVN